MVDDKKDDKAAKKAADKAAKKAAEKTAAEAKDRTAALDEGGFDRGWLKDLTFRSSEQREVVEDGKKVKKYAPTERPMKPEDVLSWKDYGDHVVIVTADGQKNTVAK